MTSWKSSDPLCWEGGNVRNTLTLFVAVDFAHDDLARVVFELLVDFVRRLVPNWGQHVAEAAPVGIEVDEDQLVVLQDRLDVVRIQLDGAAVDGVVEQVQQLDGGKMI